MIVSSLYHVNMSQVVTVDESDQIADTLAHSVARFEVALRAGDDLSVGGMIR